MDIYLNTEVITNIFFYFILLNFNLFWFRTKTIGPSHSLNLNLPYVWIICFENSFFFVPYPFIKVLSVVLLCFCLCMFFFSFLPSAIFVCYLLAKFSPMIKSNFIQAEWLLNLTLFHPPTAENIELVSNTSQKLLRWF